MGNARRGKKSKGTKKGSLATKPKKARATIRRKGSHQKRDFDSDPRYDVETDELLASGRISAAPISMALPAAAGRPAVADDREADVDGVERFSEYIDTFGSITSIRDPAIARPRMGLGDAHWPNNPANAPDTWHLPTGLGNAAFDITPNVIERIISLGAFAPDTSTNGRLVLSLRGCMIADGSDSEERIRLKAVKPDYERFRCLIGVFNITSRLISLYVASTVPRRTGMLRFYNKINFGINDVPNCNMLPTGCYEHCVGTHGGHAGEVTYVLRLGDGPTSADKGAATVLRTTNDLTYGTADMWDNTRPGDNIHPAFLSTSFSSVGCLTVRGNQTPGGSYTTGSGEWLKFRRKVGFDGTNYGRRFDNLLVTGHEAAAVAAAIESGSDTAALVCLRQGSRGEAVRLLQS
jgi:hypothetical protein